ncbi:VOC family protein [Streptomyces sp. NPDC026672]|uniref:VOC family protein n=1 Tax=unclassified Streptomyces TaxID=2593676 RepID=UPI0033EA64B0
MVSPTKLAHVVLWTSRVREMRDWYVKVLDGRITFESPAGAFITYDDEHHRIAVGDPAAAAELTARSVGDSQGIMGTGTLNSEDSPAVQGASNLFQGLAHIAFTYGSLLNLLSHYEELAKASIKPTAAVNHGPTTSLYYADPDGNQIELQVDNFDTLEEATLYMQSDSFANNPVGVPFDPAELLARLRAGALPSDLTRPAGA